MTASVACAFWLVRFRLTLRLRQLLQFMFSRASLVYRRAAGSLEIGSVPAGCCCCDCCDCCCDCCCDWGCSDGSWVTELPLAAVDGRDMTDGILTIVSTRGRRRLCY